MRPALFAAAAAACLLIGQSTALAQAPSSEPDISAERFRAHVAYLADDLLEGRETGTRGHEIAAKYIATQFDLLGLKPGGENGGWYQQVGLAETKLAGEKPTVTITSPKGESRTLTQGVEVTVVGLAAGGDTAVSAPAVFVGLGMTDKTLKIDDYKGLDVKGKVVVVLRGAPLSMESESGAHLLTQQARNAVAHGAVGMVAVRTLAGEKARPWKPSDNPESPQTTWVQKDGVPFDDNYGLKASAAMDPAVAPILFDGAKKTFAEVRAEDTATSRPKGFALKTTVAIKATTTVRKYQSPEVIGVIEGSDPALKDQYVVLMGHADHLGIRPNRAGADKIFNGALDNAAGVATLLEVARAFQSGEKPRRSVLIIANTAEEKGLLGAEYWSHYPTVPIDKITAGIDLDMPMLTYDFTDVVAYGSDHSTLSDAFKKAGAQMGVTLSPDPMPAQTIFVRSDHYALVKAGIPAVMLATGMQNGGQAQWDLFFDKHYHQVSDDLSQPIRWAQGARFAKMNYLVARDLADADQPARWYAKDYFGDLFAEKAPKADKPK